MPSKSSSALTRVDMFIKAMRLHGVPLQRGDHPRPLALQGIPGFTFRFAGRGLFSNGRGKPNINVPQVLAQMAETGSTPVAFQHYLGTPYDEAIVSMYARDWARLMVAFIETDPERYSIPRKGSQA